MTVFHGTKHNDVFDESSDTGSDTFDLYKGGEDTVIAGSGDDFINLGASLDAGDRLNGGAGRDIVTLKGDYSAGLAFADDTIQNIEVLRLKGGFDYNLTTADGNVAAGARLIVNGVKLGASDHLTFDGSAETDGHFLIYGGAGDDTITGGAKADVFHLEAGGTDSAQGGGGNDMFRFGASLDGADQIDGGGGNDTVILDGDYSLSLSITSLTSVETLALTGTHNYFIETANNNVAPGATLTVDASAVTGTVQFVGTSEADGHFHFIGGTNVSQFTASGGGQDDSFDMTQLGGSATLAGEGGNNTFLFAGNFSASDTVDGGTGNDTLELNGDYAGAHALTFGSSSLFELENLVLGAGHSYNLTTVNNNVFAGETLTVDASALGAGDQITFNGSAETNGFFDIIGGAGDDTLTGGSLAATFDLSHGGDDTATGKGGNDTFSMGAAMTAADSIDGGAGTDTLVLNGDYTGVNALVFTATTMTNVEKLDLSGAHTFDITTSDATVAAGQTLTVTPDDTNAIIVFDGSAETDGSFTINDSSGDDVLTGGAQADAFRLSLGNDTVHGGGGDDQISFSGADSFTAADSVDGGSGNDTLVLNVPVSVVLGATTLTNVETIVLGLAPGPSSFTTDDATVAAGQSLTIDAHQIGSSVLTFDGSAETDGHFVIIAANGDDVLTGGALSDTINPGRGADTVHAGGGDDTIIMGGNLAGELNNGLALDGGAGTDTVTVSGSLYTSGFLLSAPVFQSIEALQTAAGANYSFATDDSLVDSGATFTFDASALSSANTLTVNGAAETDGSFVFEFGTGYTTADTVTGGSGNDYLGLKGDFSGGITLTGAGLSSVEGLKVFAGFDYNVTTTDALVGSGQTYIVDATALGASDTLTFNASAENDGLFAITGGAGDDHIVFAANFKATDSVNGGGGNDTLELSGNYPSGFTLGANTITGIETLVLDSGNNSSTPHNYLITENDGNVATGQTLTVDASALEAFSATNGESVTFNAGAETDGSFHFIAGQGLNNFTGGAQADIFDMQQGIMAGSAGTQHINGGGGDDVINFGANLLDMNRVSINGGSGDDTLTVTADNAVNFGVQVRGIEKIGLGGGADYADFTLAGDITDGSETLTIDASGAASAIMDVTGSATHVAIIGSVGDDTAIFGSGAILAGSTFDGGAGSDTLEFRGDFFAGYTFGAAQLTSVETFTFDDGNTYSLTMNDGNVASGATLTVDASALTSGHALTFDGSAETDGAFHITGGAGNDSIGGGLGADTFTGGAGADVFNFGQAGDSTTSNLDSITDFVAGTDAFHLGFANTFEGYFGTNFTGSGLDGDLAGAVALWTANNGSPPPADFGFAFHFVSGELSGRTFVIVDTNGDAQYNAGDFVVEVTGLSGVIHASDFI